MGAPGKLGHPSPIGVGIPMVGTCPGFSMALGSSSMTARVVQDAQGHSFGRMSRAALEGRKGKGLGSTGLTPLETSSRNFRPKSLSRLLIVFAFDCLCVIDFRTGCLDYLLIAIHNLLGSLQAFALACSPSHSGGSVSGKID